MLGAAPCHGHNTSPSANGAIHPFVAYRLGVADVDCAGLWNGPSALVSGWRSVAWGVAPGWFEAAPLALASAARPTGPEAVRGQTHVARATRARATSISGPKARAIPAWGNAPCWAPPHATGTTRRQAPTARPIPAPHTSWVWRMWIARDYGTGLRPSCRVGVPLPGASPQAGMRPRRWRWPAPPAPQGRRPCVASPTSLAQREREQRPSQAKGPSDTSMGQRPMLGTAPMSRAQHVPERQRRDPSRHRIRAKGPSDTSMGQRPMLGAAPCHGHNTSPSANGATHPRTASGPKARAIPAWGTAPCWAPPHVGHRPMPRAQHVPRAPTARSIL